MGRSEYAANVVQESVEEIQEITFEIGMLEQYRQDLSDPRKAGALSSDGAVFGSHQAAGNGEGGGCTNRQRIPRDCSLICRQLFGRITQILDLLAKNIPFFLAFADFPILLHRTVNLSLQPLPIYPRSQWCYL